MKICKRVFPILLLLIFGVGAEGTWAAEEITYSGPPITLRISHFAPDTHKIMRAAFDPWIAMVEKESKGKIVVQKYFGGVLVAAKDGFKACIADIIDIAPAYTMYQAGSFQLCNGVDLPFAFPNSAVASLVDEELYPKYFKKEYEKMGVYLSNYHSNGAYNLITSKKAVRKLEDLKGMKIRSSGGTSSKMLKRLGAVPVSLPASEAYSAFQRGIVDGVCFYDAGIVSYRVHEIGQYLTEVKLNTPANSLALNRKFFDNLPPDLKRFMYNMQRRLSQMAGQAYDNEDVLNRKVITDRGIEVIHLSPQELEKWKHAVEPLYEEFIKENEGLPAREMVNEMRALSQKYSSWTQEQLMKEVLEHPVRGIVDGF
jgi:TRAP-type C4-dicarboxylate transport system substrate-binding protein